MTCLYWTIYSWKGFNLFGCPLMLRTKYRCVQSPNMSVDVAKCWENVHKFTQYTHFLSVTRNDLSWLNNLLMVMFPLIRMSSYAKNKPQMCSVTQHYFTLRQMWGKFSVTKKDMSYFGNIYIHRLFSHWSFFVTDVFKQWVYWVCENFSTFGDVYTHVGWLLSIKGHLNELKPYHE